MASLPSFSPTPLNVEARSLQMLQPLPEISILLLKTVRFDPQQLFKTRKTNIGDKTCKEIDEMHQKLSHKHSA
ncbi:hypothetical protein TNCV_781141 [Trichonephila clavipes]|nr:hypothetical protein TNCV_781141 [Trichonephila clavipes]